ncbi:MAG: COG1470 family protein [Methanosarcinaceae archaeon]
MKKYMLYIMLGLLIASILAVPNTAAVPNAVTGFMVSESEMIVEEMAGPGGAYPDMEMDFARLQVIPGYSDMQIKPGNSDKITVTVTNKDNETITVSPFVSIVPYSDYIFEESWVTITPVSADIAPDANQEFLVEVNIPQNADIGHYSTNIAFTDDVLPTPYPTPDPEYYNSMHLSVDVWTPPNIRILTPFIHGRVESGMDYDYEIKLENIADMDISIDPKIDDNNRMYDFGPFSMSSAFEDDAITITAPPVVKAGETVIVNVHLEVPGDSKGMYNGVINLNIADPSIREWDGQVHMNFEVWTQPSKPYTKSFTTRTDGPVSIEISSSPFSEYSYDMWMNAGTQNQDAPSFDVTLENESGEVEMTLVKTTHTGTVSLGMSNFPPWEIDSTGIYQDLSAGYTEQYSASGAAGDWTLGILPGNTEMFSYTITFGPGE